MWPLKSIILEKKPCSEDFNTHLCNCQENRWEIIHFESKHRHVTPQIDHLGKMSPVLRVSTNIFGVSKEIDWKTFILRVNLGMWPLQINCLAKMKTCSEDFNTHLCSFQGDRWENIHFKSKHRHVTPQINHLGKTSPVLRISTHIYAVAKKIDGKTFILRVNIGMWPLKSIILEKRALFWGFQHTFMQLPRR